MYIKNQQTYNSNRPYLHRPYISNNFKEAISEYNGVLNCKGYDYDKIPDEIMGAPLSEPFFCKENENA